MPDKKTAKEKPKKRRKIDWDAVWRVYRTGQHTNVEIAAQFNIAESSVRGRAKQYEWKKPLRKLVRDGIKERALIDELTEDGVQSPIMTDAEIAEVAIARGASILLKHRKEIASAQKIVTVLKSQLADVIGNKALIVEEIILETADDTNLKGQLSDTRRNKMLRAVSLGSYIALINGLATALKTLVALEREAFNLNDEDGGEGEEDGKLKVIRVELVTAVKAKEEKP